jgi:tyrosyl-tRNA synthetase
MDVLDTLQARGFVQQSTGLDRLRQALNAGPMTFYVGFDPTASSLHAGSLVPILAMRWMQKAGHHPIAIVGGGTAMVGDPSGKTELRKLITREQIAENMVGLRTQLSRFLLLDEPDGRMLDNGEWLLALGYVAFLRDIGRHFSVNRMLAAEAYKQRLERGLSFIEFNYQLLQAYDFLELHRRYGCLLQMGGDDQWGNILAGTDLVRRVAGADVHGLTFPLITTSSGTKMGKTARGAVWLDAERTSPFDYYQYWYNTDDSDVVRMLKLYTELPLERIAELEALEGAAIREAKAVLAFEATRMLHGEAEADRARRGAAEMVAGSGSADMPTHTVPRDALEAGVSIVVVLADAGLCKSRSEARRLIKGGAVKLNGDKVADIDAAVHARHLAAGAAVLRVGKKRAVRVVSGAVGAD